MASQRKKQANRKNAKLSTGPRTERGKATSSNNAFRHGLAIPIDRDPRYAADTMPLARFLLQGKKEPHLLGLARELAQACLEIERVDRARLLAMKHAEDPLEPRQFSVHEIEMIVRRITWAIECAARLRIATAKFFSGTANAREKELAVSGDSYMVYVKARLNAVLKESESQAIKLGYLAIELKRLDRYRERAVARRTKALRALESALAELAFSDEGVALTG